MRAAEKRYVTCWAQESEKLFRPPPGHNSRSVPDTNSNKFKDLNLSTGDDEGLTDGSSRLPGSGQRISHSRSSSQSKLTKQMILHYLYHEVWIM